MVKSVSYPTKSDEVRLVSMIAHAIPIDRGIDGIIPAAPWISIMVTIVEMNAVPPLEITAKQGIAVDVILFCAPRFCLDTDSPTIEAVMILPVVRARDRFAEDLKRTL